MEAVYKMEVTVIGTTETTRCEIKSGGRLSEVGKTILLSNVMKALNLNPDSVSDLAVVSVAFEHCQDDKVSG